MFLGVPPVLLLRKLGADFLPSPEHRAVIQKIEAQYPEEILESKNDLVKNGLRVIASNLLLRILKLG